MPDAQARLRRLLEANRQAVEHLDLSTVLRQIVEAAVEMVGVQFGALGVLGSHGNLDQFIHVGMDLETVALIGPPPEGRGLLGALIEDPQPVRLPRMVGDPRSVGFPPHHPPMESFLGVPLEVRGEIFGHLYLADPRTDVFTDEDQQLVEALAATAGVAISHARLFEETKRREQWTVATSRITHELLTSDEVDALQLIAQTVLDLAGADLVTVILAETNAGSPGKLLVDRAAGVERKHVVGAALGPGSLVARCLQARRPELIDETDDTMFADELGAASRGPAMAVPLLAGPGARGCLFVLRDRGALSFTEFDLDVAASLAGQAALALDRADARSARARTATLEDRDRIARDLHDHVVQRLFAAGLNIQSVAATLDEGPLARRLTDQVDEIDATIRQIRNTIFGLHAGRGSEGIRARVLDVIRTASVTLDVAPEVSFRGPLDLLVSGSLADDIVAVVREGLTNVGRHAAAERVELVVTADAHSVAVEVLDDGKGLSGDVILSGLANLRARADARGGSFDLSPRTGRGARLFWTAPVGT